MLGRANTPLCSFFNNQRHEQPPLPPLLRTTTTTMTVPLRWPPARRLRTFRTMLSPSLCICAAQEGVSKKKKPPPTSCKHHHKTHERTLPPMQRRSRARYQTLPARPQTWALGGTCRGSCAEQATEVGIWNEVSNECERKKERRKKKQEKKQSRIQTHNELVDRQTYAFARRILSYCVIWCWNTLCGV